MTYFPTKIRGDKPPYFFVSRLTENDNHSDADKPGDRKLLVLLGHSINY